MKAGYTLLELLTVVTIILLLVSVGGVSYGRFNNEKGLERDVEAFADLLNLARERTVARDLTAQNCLNFAGYRVVVDPGNLVYQLLIMCTTFTEVSRYQIQNSTVTSAVAPYNLDFVYPYGEARLAAGALPHTVTFRNNRLPRCKSVTISRTGVIRVSDTFDC